MCCHRCEALSCSSCEPAGKTVAHKRTLSVLIGDARDGFSLVAQTVGEKGGAFRWAMVTDPTPRIMNHANQSIHTLASYCIQNLSHLNPIWLGFRE